MDCCTSNRIVNDGYRTASNSTKRYPLFFSIGRSEEEQKRRQFSYYLHLLTSAISSICYYSLPFPPLLPPSAKHLFYPGRVYSHNPSYPLKSSTPSSLCDQSTHFRFRSPDYAVEQPLDNLDPISQERIDLAFWKSLCVPVVFVSRQSRGWLNTLRIFFDAALPYERMLSGI